MAAIELGSTKVFNYTSLQAYYKGENVNDSKNSNNLTNTNAVAFNAGKFTNAFDFGAANSTKYVSIANSLSLINYQVDKLTFAGWINISTAPAGAEQQSIFGVEVNAKLQTQIYYQIDSGTFNLNYQQYNGTTAENLKIAQTFTTGTWYHLGCIKNGTSVIFYVNGVALSTLTITLADASPARPAQFIMGTAVFDLGSYYKGLIDDVGVFNDALTASDMNGLANGFPIAGGFFDFF